MIAFCPKEEDLVYGNFDCEDTYNGNGEAQVIYETIQYKKFNNFRISLMGNPSAGEQLSFSILTKSNNKVDISAAISEISNFLNSLGFDLDDYEYAASICGFCGPQD